MTAGLYTVFPEATLKEVVHALTAFRVHRVFVIQEQGAKLLGIITTMDVLKWMDAKLESGKKRARSAKA